MERKLTSWSLYRDGNDWVWQLPHGSSTDVPLDREGDNSTKETFFFIIVVTNVDKVRAGPILSNRGMRFITDRIKTGRWWYNEADYNCPCMRGVPYRVVREVSPSSYTRQKETHNIQQSYHLHSAISWILRRVKDKTKCEVSENTEMCIISYRTKKGPGLDTNDTKCAAIAALLRLASSFSVARRSRGPTVVSKSLKAKAHLNVYCIAALAVMLE